MEPHPDHDRSHQVLPILVTGGSGTLGRHVVPRLRETGRDVRVLSRSARRLGPGVEVVEGDLMTGAGVRAALAGVDTVLASPARPRTTTSRPGR